MIKVLVAGLIFAFAWFVPLNPSMQFSPSAHRWHSLPHLSFDSDLWSVFTIRCFDFFSNSDRFLIPSLCGSRRSARIHHTSSKKCAGCSLLLTVFEALNGTIGTDSVRGWFIDRCPQLNYEYSKSYRSLPEITFAHRLSSQKLEIVFIQHHGWLWDNNWLKVCVGLCSND